MWLAPALLLAIPALHAQDTRNVTEPHIPPACLVLGARLSAPHGVLSDSSERKPDTTRLQAAIDHCASGEAVELKPQGGHNIFLTGPIQLKPGVTLLVDANAALFASRNPRDYDIRPGSCGKVGPRGNGGGCKPLILADHAPGSGIMGDGSIDGRGGAKLLGQNVTWWDLSREAKVQDMAQSVTRILVVRQSDNFTLYRITLRNSPNFHVSVNQTNGFTAWGVKILTPKTARNTDGIDPTSSTNVTIEHCDISTGDDDVAIKTAATGPSAHMTIAHNHFYTGHGMSIGSATAGGVSNIRVSDLSIDGADNGIRIKSDRSRGGLVQDVSYEDVCMRNVTNPIVLTPLYTTFSGNKLPIYRDIVLKNVHSVTSGWFTVLGLDAGHKLDVTFDNVSVDGLTPDHVQAANADIHVGPIRGNFVPSGPGVSITDTGASAADPLSCSARFVPFPAIPTAPEAAVIAPPEDKTLYVAADGTGDFYSIQRAIDVAPADGAVISIAPGTYREVLDVDKPNIHLRSARTDASETVIVFDKSAGTAGGTTRSATVNVRGDNFFAENLTFANDFNATHPQLPQGSQALALLVTGDRAVFRNMRFLGNQDTLYAANKRCLASASQPCAPSRQYFSHCYIEGNVDFIFGNSKAVFDHCEIHSTPHSEGFLTAQSKNSPNEDSIYVFDHCKLTAAPGVANVYLGRPWRPYASVVFLNTEMGGHIVPAGWREWHPGETHSIETAYYAEYNSTGPGAHPGERDPHTKKLTAAEAARYESPTFLAGTDGWDPAKVR
ncbi:MAG TPA: pectinesterase family protein [Bryobacteraceae bacterium]|nr:pectinesterase family protein [Bryobacteraceae bacterium]